MLIRSLRKKTQVNTTIMKVIEDVKLLLFRNMQEIMYVFVDKL